jgi:hypothetical protein
MEKNMIEKTYIGDGVYADFNGYHIVLTSENGIGITNTIYLEDSVFIALQEFAKKVFGYTEEDLAE